jgi:hypothetical protein
VLSTPRADGLRLPWWRFIAGNDIVENERIGAAMQLSEQCISLAIHTRPRPVAAAFTRRILSGADQVAQAPKADC